MFNDQKERNETVYIFSVYVPGMREYTNRENHDFVVSDMRISGIGAKSVEGCYKGQKEMAIVTTSERHAMRLANAFGQESVLKLSPLDGVRRKATFIYLNPHLEPKTGIWEPCTQEEALKHDGYTRDGDNYFIVR